MGRITKKVLNKSLKYRGLQTHTRYLQIEDPCLVQKKSWKILYFFVVHYFFENVDRTFYSIVGNRN